MRPSSPMAPHFGLQEPEVLSSTPASRPSTGASTESLEPTGRALAFMSCRESAVRILQGHLWTPSWFSLVTCLSQPHYQYAELDRPSDSEERTWRIWRQSVEFPVARSPERSKAQAERMAGAGGEELVSGRNSDPQSCPQRV